MRKKRTCQISIFHQFTSHQIGQELQAMSLWLDQFPEAIDWVFEDLPSDARFDSAAGRPGLTGEAALRCALLKQYRELSYEELAFYLLDSMSFQAFARLPDEFVPTKSTLHSAISDIRPQTWERLNRLIIGGAVGCKFERGRKIRIDSTVVDAPIHPPSDNSYLWYSEQVMVRLLEQAEQFQGAPRVRWHNHTRVAKCRFRQIGSAKRNDKRSRYYRDLVAYTQKTMGYLGQAVDSFLNAPMGGVAVEAWYAEVRDLMPLVVKVIAQTERRVFEGESVPATEKLFSLFEPHTDIIVKGGRDVQYGHKLNLVSGASGLILDAVVESGNPADSERFVPMLERQCAVLPARPKQIAADGGYASQANLEAAKAMGYEDVCFHKRVGLTVEAMVKSHWVYRQLRNFRAGIEGNISCLKRAYGLARCTWKGLTHFNAYVWSSVVAYNLALIARHKPAPT